MTDTTTVVEPEYDAGDFALATQEYQSLVDMCAKNDLCLTIPNNHIEHAAILTRAILDRSKDYARIVTGSFPEFFMNEVADSLRNALARGVKVTVVIAHYEPHDMLTEFIQAHRGKFSVYQMTNCAKRLMHFCVSDGIRWRAEAIHDQIDWTVEKSVMAQANFNYPEIAKRLSGIFTHLLQHPACTAVT